jgi:putative aminopeptidase FrvX
MTHEECVKKAEKENRARIYYNWWGNANINNREWILLAPNGELEDYHTKKHLIETCKKNNWKYQVERHCKKIRNKVIIMEQN